MGRWSPTGTSTTPTAGPSGSWESPIAEDVAGPSRWGRSGRAGGLPMGSLADPVTPSPAPAVQQVGGRGDVRLRVVDRRSRKAGPGGPLCPGTRQVLEQPAGAGAGVAGVRVPVGLAGHHADGPVDVARLEVLLDQRP